jgi:hypothetical protein
MHQRGEREKALRTEGVNQRRKRLLQNTPKARAGWPAERPSGLGGLGRGGGGWANQQAKAEGVGGPAGPSGLNSEE